MGAKEVKPDLFDVQLEMKMASRQMAKESKRAEASEKTERKKVADVIDIFRLIRVVGNWQRTTRDCSYPRRKRHSKQ